MTQYKDIKVYLNGRANRRSDSWLSIDMDLRTGLCYLLTDEGRVYFSLISPTNEVVDLNHNDEKQSISFRYIGLWVDEYNDDEIVNYLFEIIFINSDDYENVRSIWQEAEKINLKEK